MLSRGECMQRYARRNFRISVFQLVRLILAVLMAFMSGLLRPEGRYLSKTDTVLLHKCFPHVPIERWAVV